MAPSPMMVFENYFIGFGNICMNHLVGFMKFRTRSRTLLIILISLAASMLLMGNVFLNSFQGVGEGTGDYPPPSDGDWIITSETHIQEETLTFERNIVIQDGGKLTLDNVTLILNASNYGELWISVKNGGELNIINNSKLMQGTSEVNYDFMYENGSSGKISESEIRDCGWDDGGTFLSTGGVLISSEDVVVENSSFHHNYMGIITFSVSPKIANNEITDNLKYGITLVNSSSQIIGNKISFNPVGIYSLYSDPKIIDNEIMDNGDGARFYYSSVSIKGGEFSSNSPDDCTTGACSADESGKGLLVEASNLTMDGVEVSYNSKGLIAQYSLVELNNCTFRDNLVDGISGEFSEANMSYNLFANNTRYGINWMYTLLEVDDTNIFSENTGEARIIQLWDVKVRVIDSSGDWISNAKIEFEGSGNSYSSTTTITGMATKAVAEYIITNDGIKVDYNTYKVTAKKKASWDGVEYSNYTTEEIIYNTEIDVVIPLKKPDLLVKKIEFSKTPVVDSEVKIKVKVANEGDTIANNVSIVVTQKDSSGRSQIVNKSTFSIGPLQELTMTFKWTPYVDGDTSVIAELDSTKNIKETNEENNELEVTVDVSQKAAPLFDDSYFMAGLIMFIIIFIGVALYLLTFKKKVNEEG
jgi:parallel beta-helix repeat protein